MAKHNSRMRFAALAVLAVVARGFCAPSTQVPMVITSLSSAEAIAESRHNDGPLSNVKVGTTSWPLLEDCTTLANIINLDETFGSIGRVRQTLASFRTCAIAARLAPSPEEPTDLDGDETDDGENYDEEEEEEEDHYGDDGDFQYVWRRSSASDVATTPTDPDVVLVKGLDLSELLHHQVLHQDWDNVEEDGQLKLTQQTTRWGPSIEWTIFDDGA